MPELPEVERGRRIAERAAAGRRIERVVCSDDRIVYKGVTPARFRRSLTGRRVVASHRRGKYLWFELDERPWPVFHFGMTGAFHLPGADGLVLKASPAPGREWPPRFSKVRFVFDDGGELAMTNARRLGRIRLLDDPPNNPPIRDLGFDPLLDLPSPTAFRELVASRRVTLKGLLLDQSFAAGVGNWIADEVLFQAKLDPRRPAAGLSTAEIGRLRTRLRSVVAKAVEADAESSRFPPSWLFHHRWGKDESATTSAGERIEFLTVAGRTTAWVPARQQG